MRRTIGQISKITRGWMSAVGAVVIIGGGIAAEVHFKNNHEEARVTKWLRAEVLPYGGTMIEPHWTLELAATMDSPTALKLVIDDTRRRHGGATIATLQSRFALVIEENGAHFDAPLMTAPEDDEAVHALARFTESAHRSVEELVAGPRGLASVVR